MRNQDNKEQFIAVNKTFDFSGNMILFCPLEISKIESCNLFNPEAIAPLLIWVKTNPVWKVNFLFSPLLMGFL